MTRCLEVGEEEAAAAVLPTRLITSRNSSSHKLHCKWRRGVATRRRTTIVTHGSSFFLHHIAAISSAIAAAQSHTVLNEAATRNLLLTYRRA